MITIEAVIAEAISESNVCRTGVAAVPEHIDRSAAGPIVETCCRSAIVFCGNAVERFGAHTDDVNARVWLDPVECQRRVFLARKVCLLRGDGNGALRAFVEHGRESGQVVTCVHGDDHVAVRGHFEGAKFYAALGEGGAGQTKKEDDLYQSVQVMISR